MGADLDIGLMADTPVGQGVNLANLAPVFETNFLRRILMLEDERAAIECALDQGSVLAGSHRRDLCELELELKQGDPDTLLGWARALAGQVPVFLNLISKAEQGYVIAGLHHPVPLSDGEPLVNRVLHGLSRAWLSGAVDVALIEDLDRLQNQDSVPAAQANDLAWLRERLDAGDAIAELAASTTRLGQLQLSLLA